MMIAYPHQVGGHGVFSRLEELGRILKPLIRKELLFYRAIWSDKLGEEMGWLRHWTARFYGVWEEERGLVGIEEGEAGSMLNYDRWVFGSGGSAGSLLEEKGDAKQGGATQSTQNGADTDGEPLIPGKLELDNAGKDTTEAFDDADGRAENDNHKNKHNNAINHDTDRAQWDDDRDDDRDPEAVASPASYDNNFGAEHSAALFAKANATACSALAARGNHYLSQGSANLPIWCPASGSDGEPNENILPSFGMSPWSARMLENQKKKKKRSRQCYLVLEDLTAGFTYPCILDCKIGVRQYDDDAPDAKKTSQIRKSKATTSFTLGMRMTGMQWYNAEKKTFEFKDKYYGRTLKEQDLVPELCSFFHNGVRFRREVVLVLLPKLKELLEHMKQQHLFKFYSSSLLIIYEGDEASDAYCNDNKSIVDVRMIDFAHTQLSHGDTDEGYTLGISNLIKFLTELLNRTC